MGSISQIFEVLYSNGTAAAEKKWSLGSQQLIIQGKQRYTLTAKSDGTLEVICNDGPKTTALIRP